MFGKDALSLQKWISVLDYEALVSVLKPAEKYSWNNLLSELWYFSSKLFNYYFFIHRVTLSYASCSSVLFIIPELYWFICNISHYLSNEVDVTYFKLNKNILFTNRHI